jgi:adenine-specific DNA methylase
MYIHVGCMVGRIARREPQGSVRSNYIDINLAFFYTKQDRHANTSCTYACFFRRSKEENKKVTKGEYTKE